MDGDTITVLDAFTYQRGTRLTGMDAPEAGQALGHRSKETHPDCAIGMRATVDGDKLDRYGRRVTCQPLLTRGRAVVKNASG